MYFSVTGTKKMDKNQCIIAFCCMYLKREQNYFFYSNPEFEIRQPENLLLCIAQKRKEGFRNDRWL